MGPGGAPSGEGPRPSAKDIGHKVAAARALASPLPQPNGSGDTPTTVGARPETLRDQAVKAVVAEQQTEPEPTPVRTEPEHPDRTQEEGLTAETAEGDRVEEHVDDADQAEPAAEAKERNEALNELVTPASARLITGRFNTEAHVDFQLNTVPDDIPQHVVQSIQDLSLAERDRLTLPDNPTKWQENWDRAQTRKTEVINNILENPDDFPEGVDTLLAVGLLTTDDEGQAIFKPENLNKFFNKYAHEAGDMVQLAKDIQEGLVDEETGAVDVAKLRDRLTIISKVSGLAHNELLKELAFAHAALQIKDTEALRQTIEGKMNTPIEDDDPSRNYLDQLSRQQEAELRPDLTVKAGGANERGINGETENRVWVDAEKGIGLLCEGIGGGESGAKASALVLNRLRSAYLTLKEPHTTAELAQSWILDEITKANAFLAKRKEDGFIPQDAATGVSLVHVWTGPEGQSKTITVHIGGARLAQQEDGGAIEDLTLDDVVRYKMDRKFLRLKKNRVVKDGREIDLPVMSSKLRNKDEAHAMQQAINHHGNTDLEELDGQAQLAWNTRGEQQFTNKLTGGELDRSHIQTSIRDITPGKPLRIIGLSGEVVHALTKPEIRAALGQDPEGDPQAAAENVVATAANREQNPRGPRLSDDMSAFVLDINLSDVQPANDSEPPVDDGVQTDGEVVGAREEVSLDDLLDRRQETAS